MQDKCQSFIFISRTSCRWQNCDNKENKKEEETGFSTFNIDIPDLFWSEQNTEHA